MPEVAADALSIVLADWKAAYLIIDRLGITIQRDPYTVKPFVEFYTRKRVGGDVDNWEAIKIGKISA
jgi:HK97 family phage major capsid protein